MSRMRIALLLPLLLVASCATTLVKQDIKRQSDGWTIVFHELDDGPDSFTTRDAYQMSPPSGQRFLWVILSVHNDGAKARAFSFDSCNLPLAALIAARLRRHELRHQRRDHQGPRARRRRRHRRASSPSATPKASSPTASPAPATTSC